MDGAQGFLNEIDMELPDSFSSISGDSERCGGLADIDLESDSRAC